ncbi:MAG: transporter substrate-binding domain-containing protein [Hyphomicrobiales bacterium]|nr:transporter substrate-binding domain-containing protein [Hyphomicrobiales bacterium]
MRKLIFCLATVLLAGMSVVPAKADLKDIIDKGVIRIGTQMDNPPFGYLDENGKPTGFDVELGEMIGKALGVKVQVEQIIGANRIPFLLTNKIDLVISGMGATPERAVQVMFTSPYAALYLGVYGHKARAVSGPDQLSTLRISATKGTTQDLTLTAMAPKANIVRFEDDTTSNTAFLSGQVDLWATLNTIAAAIAKKNPDQPIELKFKLRDSPAHMAMRQGDFALLHSLDTYIFLIRTNGELQRLHCKWLGEDMGNLSAM